MGIRINLLLINVGICLFSFNAIAFPESVKGKLALRSFTFERFVVQSRLLHEYEICAPLNLMGAPITPNSGAVKVLVDPPSVTLATFNIVGLFSGLVLADNQTALTDFFFGHDGQPGLQDLAADLGAIDAQQINTMKMGEDIEIRVGRYGAYLQQGQGDERKFANIPEGMAPDELTLQKAIELLAAPSGERELGIDPTTSLPIIAKSGRIGPYITEVLPEPEGKKKKEVKAKTASLLSTMTLDTVTLDDALKLLSLPRTLGVDSQTGDVITVQNGRYGPYLKRGEDSRTLTTEDQLFTITLDQAEEIYKQPKVKRRGVAKPPRKDLGIDPTTNKQIIIKDGRFGMYVTDGETNATLRRGDTVEAMTIERAQELLAGRRAWEIAQESEVGVTKPSRLKGKKKQKKAPTLTEKTISDAGSKKKAKRSATGKAKLN